ncbi:MAG: hypothetical protein EKK55_17275 [Rhodocyclaceae bacterium]|nr:MAG: hypothetical protein EKK55_17275 [Rhodocyclaceae bacterium]
MSEKIVEAETIDENEIDVLPTQTGVIAGVMGIEDQLTLAENIDKLVAAQNKIRMALLKLAQSGDWVIFGDGDREKAELNFAGAMRIGSVLGVSYTNWAAEKETGTDDKGQWYRWNYECDAVFKGRVVRVYGRAGSRDKFFGKARGEFKELSDIDEGNIRQAARRGAMKEGVKVMFGLHHMDPTELTKFGVRMERASGVSFKSADKKADEAKTVTVGIETVTVKQGDNWKKYTITDVEGVVYSTFSETAAKTAKEAKESKKQVTITFTSTEKYGNEAKSVVLVEGAPK